MNNPLFSWKHQNLNHSNRENIKRGKNHLSTTNNIAPVQYYSYQNNESGKSLFLALKLANVWGSKKSNIWTVAKCREAGLYWFVSSIFSLNSKLWLERSKIDTFGSFLDFGGFKFLTKKWWHEVHCQPDSWRRQKHEIQICW